MTRTALWGAFAWLLGVPAFATTFPSTTTRDLALRAERICCARCEAVETRLDPQTGLVFSHVRLRLLENLKGGSEGTTVRLRIVGGRAGNVITRVAGMPQFRAGEESVLFLGKRNRLGYPVVMDAARGVVGIRKDAKDRRLLSRPVTGFSELGSKRRVSLDEFRGAVLRSVGKRAAR